MTDFRRISALVLAIMAMILIMPSVGLAQNMVNISGTVVDQGGGATQGGGAIPGAVVQILDDAKQTLVRTATTDDSGRFEVLYVEPGTYTIQIEKDGFKKLARRGVILDVTTKVYDSTFQLEVGTVAQSVSVTAITPLVQTTTGEKSFLMEQKLIADLPIDGRFFNALVATLPAVSDNGQSNFNIQNGTYLSDLHIAGGRASQNQVYLRVCRRASGCVVGVQGPDEQLQRGVWAERRRYDIRPDQVRLDHIPWLGLRLSAQ